MLRKLLVVLAIAGWGCVPDADVEPTSCHNEQPGTMEIGAGDMATGYKPMHDGDNALVTLGPQGLHMILVSVKLQNYEAPQVGAGRTQLWLSLYHGSKLLGATPVTQEPMMQADGTMVFLGLRPTITADDAKAYFDKLATVEVSIRDGCDRMVTGKRVVKLIQ